MTSTPRFRGKRNLAPKSHWMDVWFPRLSHFAQFGLFIFTIGSLYFTVLPLYQKALLDEAIAKKEVELKAASSTLSRMYGQIRAFAVREYAIYTGAECSGLFRRPEELAPLGAKTPPRPLRAEAIFAIDVPQCLLDAMQRAPSLNELSKNDLAFFKEQIRLKGETLKAAREQSLARYRAVSVATVSEAQAASLPASSARVRMLEFLSRLYPPEEMLSRRKALAAEIERERIGTEYESLISQEVHSLRRLTWPSGERA